MVLNKENAGSLYDQYKEEFRKSIVDILEKQIGIKTSLEAYLNRIGKEEFAVFVDWYNETVDKVDENYFKDIVLSDELE